MLAITELAKVSPGCIGRIFRKECPACGGNHYERASQILRVVKYIHPDAISAIREARVPERYLTAPFFADAAVEIPSDPAELDRALKDPKFGRALRRTMRLRYHLPVWRNDAAKTRLVQIGYAHKYRLKKGF